MFDKGEIRRHLLGSLETALFMPGGPERFCTSARAMKASFLIPVLLLPLTLVTVFSGHPLGVLDMTSAQILTAIYSLRLFVYLALYCGLVYVMAKSTGRLDHFHRFVTANNWLTLPAAALMVPLLALFLNGAYGWSEVYPLMVFITLYSYAYTAFMAMYVMRVNWELAGFIAIAGMAIHQSSLGALKWIAVNTLYLVS